MNGVLILVLLVAGLAVLHGLIERHAEEVSRRGRR